MLFQVLLLLCLSHFSLAQCVLEKNESLDLDSLDDADTQWINLNTVDPKNVRSDSLLLLYITNPENHTYYGRQCSYGLAADYAELEIDSLLLLLEDVLQPDDWEQLKISQQKWREYYEAEFKFHVDAFMTYSNFDKYGLGRESSVGTIASKYYMARDRYMTLWAIHFDLTQH